MTTFSGCPQDRVTIWCAVTALIRSLQFQPHVLSTKGAAGPSGPGRAAGFKVVPAQSRDTGEGLAGREAVGGEPDSEAGRPGALPAPLEPQPRPPLPTSAGPAAPAFPWPFSSQTPPGLGGQEGRGTAGAALGLTKSGYENPRLFGGTCPPRLTGLLGIPRAGFPGAPLPSCLGPQKFYGESRELRGGTPLLHTHSKEPTVNRLDIPDRKSLLPSPPPNQSLSREASLGTRLWSPHNLGPFISPPFWVDCPELKIPRSTHPIPLSPNSLQPIFAQTQQECPSFQRTEGRPQDDGLSLNEIIAT